MRRRLGAWSPGPWVARVKAPARIGRRMFYAVTNATDYWTVCEVRPALGPSARAWERARANANLIAAAPGLCLALDDLLHNPNDPAARGRAVEVLAEVRNGTPAARFQCWPAQNFNPGNARPGLDAHDGDE